MAGVEGMQTAPLASGSPHQVSPPLFRGGERTIQLNLINHSSVPEKPLSGSYEGESGSSAREMLKNVKEEDDHDLDLKKKPRLFGRKSSSPFQQVPEDRKHYAKMGILMANSPDVQTNPFPDRCAEMAMNATLPSGARWPMHSTPQQKYLSMPTRLTTRSTMSHVSDRSEPRLSSEQSIPSKSDSFDLLDDTALKVVGNGSLQGGLSMLSAKGNSTTQQPSPPISLKNETKEEPACTASPDSGYGNTPENGAGATNASGSSLHQTQKMLGKEETHSGVMKPHSVPDTLHSSPRSEFDNHATSKSFGSSPQASTSLETQQTRPQLTSSGLGEELFGNDLKAQNMRAQGDSSDGRVVAADENLLSDQLVSDASKETTDSTVGRGPPSHRHTITSVHSVPEQLVAATASESSPYASIHKHFQNTHAAPQPPPHVQSLQYSHPSSAIVGSSRNASERLSMSTRLAAEVNDNDFSSLDSSPFRRRAFQMDSNHPSSMINLHGRAGTVNEGNRYNKGPAVPVDSSLHGQEKGNVAAIKQRSRGRSNSQPPIKSLEVHLPMAEEKDYFTVTDELSRENAHFALSEALLVVIEQYKSNHVEQSLDNGSTDTGSEVVGSEDMDGRALQSLSPQPPYRVMTPPTSVGSPSSWGSAESGLSPLEDLSEASLPQRSPAPPRISLLELIKSRTGDNSAESTAQQLLQHMAEQLTGNPTGGLNMSQTVLLLPTDFLTSLKMDEDLQKSITTSSAHMRGSKDWAPPRRQIIFHVKTPSKNLQKDLLAQGYRCTGCGMKVDPSYARYFRFCNYTGKYFCQNCHTNALSVIPAQIIDKWSFKRFYVSNFARDLLAKIYQEPVFNVQTVNRNIYSRVPAMAQALELRMQLVSIKQYLKVCRRAKSLHLTFEGYSHWATDHHLYSIDDFHEVKSGVKLKYVKSLLADAVQHVKTCAICQGKGFVCEFCKDPGDIIYPFEIHKVSTCPVCQCCFHKECFSKACPRCIRVQERQRQRVSRIVFKVEEEEEEEEGEGSHDEQPS